MSRTFMAMQREGLRLRKMFVSWAGWSGQIYFQHRVDQYREMWRSFAAAEGGTFTQLAPDLWQIDFPEGRVRILNYQMEFDDPVTLGLAGRKTLVHQLLGQAGLPIPEHAVFTLDRLDEARRFVEQHPPGCVIKPASGYGGKGVTTHIQAPAEVRAAALLASVYDAELLVEAMVGGESYRLLVLEGRVVDAVCRRGPRVTGDARSTVRELLAAENSRRAGAHAHPIDVDRDCLFTLRSQGLTLDSQPAQGRVVLARSMEGQVRKRSEVRTVYTNSVVDLICESIRRDAEKAARLVGSDLLGVDVITLDPTVPLRDAGGVINEVNTTPALHHHYDPTREPYPAVARPIVQALLRRHAAGVAPD